MKLINKLIAGLSIFALLALTITTSALAFDGRAGDHVVIEADEVIADDLYVSATTFTLNGTVQGDLVVAGETIVINGTVEGDLIAAGQNIVINGTVADDVRIAGAALQLGEKGVIGDDVLGASASMEAKKGSQVDGDFVYAGAQALLAGQVNGDAMFGAGSVELRGSIQGDVTAEVGDPEDAGAPPTTYMWQSGISVPSVQPGFTIAEDASIGGDLTYMQTRDLDLPSAVVAGEITRNEPVMDVDDHEAQPTPAQAAMNWSLDLMRSIVTLTGFGLLFGWLAPKFTQQAMIKLQNAPAASLGWGLVSYAAFFFALLVILMAMGFGTIVFGALTLGGISGTIFWAGFLAIFALTVGFVITTAFLTKVLVAWLGGKWLINRVRPELSEHKVWPLLIGVVLLALLVALPFVGWIFGLLSMFLGLGALWLWGREAWQARKTA